VRVGLPPAIVLDLRSEVSYVVTLVAPTADHEGTSCPHIVFIGSGRTSAWGMTLNTTGRATYHELNNESKTDRASRPQAGRQKIPKDIFKGQITTRGRTRTRARPRHSLRSAGVPHTHRAADLGGWTPTVS